MQPEELARASAFVVVVVGVFVQAAWVIGRRVVLALLRRTSAPSARGQAYERGILALAAAGLACVLYGRFVEPYWLATPHVRVPLARVGSGGVKILHFSDLHCDAHKRLEDRLPEVAAAEKPDLITFSGDAVNGPEGLEHFRETMSALAKVAPVYAVLGNWDAWINAGLRFYDDLPVHLLSADGELVTVRGTRLWISGTGAARSGHLQRLMQERPKDAVAVYIHHFPDSIEDAAALGCDLYLCGHTHGGQVALPFYGALVTFARFGKRYERGLYRVGSMWAYVNPGVGMEGGPAPRVRFWVRPELTVLELVPREP